MMMSKMVNAEGKWNGFFTFFSIISSLNRSARFQTTKTLLHLVQTLQKDTSRKQLEIGKLHDFYCLVFPNSRPIRPICLKFRSICFNLFSLFVDINLHGFLLSSPLIFRGGFPMWCDKNPMRRRGSLGTALCLFLRQAQIPCRSMRRFRWISNRPSRALSSPR